MSIPEIVTITLEYPVATLAETVVQEFKTRTSGCWVFLTIELVQDGTGDEMKQKRFRVSASKI
jgi:hypothetical protein